MKINKSTTSWMVIKDNHSLRNWTFFADHSLLENICLFLLLRLSSSYFPVSFYSPLVYNNKSQWSPSSSGPAELGQSILAWSPSPSSSQVQSSVPFFCTFHFFFSTVPRTDQFIPFYNPKQQSLSSLILSSLHSSPPPHSTFLRIHPRTWLSSSHMSWSTFIDSWSDNLWPINVGTKTSSRRDNYKEDSSDFCKSSQEWGFYGGHFSIFLFLITPPKWVIAPWDD